MQTVTYEVLVHKAGLALQAGESVGTYTQKLRSAVAEHVMKKLNLTQKTASVYMVEAYGDAAVVDVYMRAATPDGPSTYKYYAVKYTRKDNGAFDFSETTQVMPVTTYQPVDTMAVAKSVGLTESGSDKKLEATRDGKKVKVDIGDKVQPGDVLFVGERMF